VVDHRQNVSATNHVLSCLPASNEQLGHGQRHSQNAAGRDEEKARDVSSAGVSTPLAKL
jgi:hypothetical protein